ncbi:MAG TPA: hypothetical protein VGC91_09270 [Pyrinomonadaceae bacterium]
MKLPNADRAEVNIAKLRDYSLNPEHDEGKHKARVFRSALGFTIEDSDKPRRIILERILTGEATQHIATNHGERFVVDFEVDGLKGSVTIRTAWMVKISRV